MAPALCEMSQVSVFWLGFRGSRLLQVVSYSFCQLALEPTCIFLHEVQMCTSLT